MRDLKARRLEAGLSQKELAAKAGIDHRTISAAERGRGISESSYQALERALGPRQSFSVKEE